MSGKQDYRQYCILQEEKRNTEHAMRNPEVLRGTLICVQGTIETEDADTYFFMYEESSIHAMELSSLKRTNLEGWMNKMVYDIRVCKQSCQQGFSRR